MPDNPILEAFRARFVRNPEVNDLTPFGFFEAGWRALEAENERLRAALEAVGDDARPMTGPGAFWIVTPAIARQVLVALGRAKPRQTNHD